MGELKILWEVVKLVAQLVFFLVGGLFKIGRAVVRWTAAKVGGKVRDARDEGPGVLVPTPSRLARAQLPVKAAPAVPRAEINRLTAALNQLATQAQALDARCKIEPLCAPLQPTVRDLLQSALVKANAELRRATTMQAASRVAMAAASLDQRLQLLRLMVDQRCDPNLDELIDDADALAESCYLPVVDYCRSSGVPLSSNRTATLFGDGCSPWLGRIDDPTGLAVLQLPWKWMAEVHRWPAIGHEVGHDFYDSVDGLDEELLRRSGLAGLVGAAQVIDQDDDVTVRDVQRIVTRWRHELAADAFGAMMFGPAFAVTTATIFASPGDPAQALAVQVEGGKENGQYEGHPPGHVRVAAVCRLLARMGYGALAEGMERRWRAQHRDPRFILLPTTSGYFRVDDEPFIEAAVAFTTLLQREGFAALKGIPLSSMPGFDFGPREQVASLRIRDAFLADARPSPADARLLIAGAVLAWAERPAENVRLLRAARRAVGKLDRPVAAGAGAGAERARARSSGVTRDLVRDAILLDVLLSPPRASLLRR